MFSYPDMELIARKSIRGRSGLHNLWMTADGQLISCHSEAGALLDVDGDEVLWEAGTQVYIRGLAVTGDVVVLGETQRTVRGHRRSSMGGLWILDRRSWRAIDYLSLGPFGGVHEVRLLDVPDEAHHNHVFLGLPRLAACDLGADLARQRLASAAAAHVARGCWRGYDLVFGAPETDDMGFRVASPEDLCLAVRAKAAPNPEVAFDYALHREGQHSNVAAVVDYRGSGADTQMTALLLQAASTGAVSSVWRHDGKNWAHLTGAGRGDLPLQGRACLRPVPTGLALMVDGTPVLSVPAAQPVAADGVRGIRWIGARVRPASPED
jgi:hypothetical protein